jgi:hypothetical protein
LSRYRYALGAPFTAVTPMAAAPLVSGGAPAVAIGGRPLATGAGPPVAAGGGGATFGGPTSATTPFIVRRSRLPSVWRASRVAFARAAFRTSSSPLSALYFWPLSAAGPRSWVSFDR